MILLQRSQVSPHPATWTALTADLVAALKGDAVAALVLSRITFRTDPQFNPSGWWRANLALVARETGLTPRQVEHAVGRLREAGLLESTRELLDGPWDRTLTYRPVFAGDLNPQASPAGGAGPTLKPHPQEGQGPHPQEGNVPSSQELKDSKKKALPQPGAAAPVEDAPAALELILTDPPPPDRFDEFWSIWPRRVEKVDARKAWAKAVAQVGAETILAGARRVRDDPNRPELRYVKHPATWLRSGGWADDPYPPLLVPPPPLGRRQSDTDALFARAAARLGLDQPPPPPHRGELQ